MKVEEKNFLKLSDKVLNKDEVLRSISSLLYPSNSQKTYDAFIWRENQSSTGLVDGFAIPHAKLDFIIETEFYFIGLNEPVEWESLDNNPVDTLVVLLIPEGTSHIGMLSKFSRLMMKKQFKESIRVKDVEQINKLLGE